MAKGDQFSSMVRRCPMVTPSRWLCSSQTNPIQYKPSRSDPLPWSIRWLFCINVIIVAAVPERQSRVGIRFWIRNRESRVESLDRTLSQTDWQLNWKVWRHFSLFDLLLPLSSWARYAKIAENISLRFSCLPCTFLALQFLSYTFSCPPKKKCVHNSWLKLPIFSQLINAAMLQAISLNY